MYKKADKEVLNNRTILSKLRKNHRLLEAERKQ